MQVDSRVAVVTGAAGGIGAALARELLARGARVAISDLDAVRLDSTAGALRAEHPGRVVALAGDAGDSSHLRALIHASEAELGPVALFFANAGVEGGVGLEADEAAWRQALEVNVMAHVRAAQLLVPAWLERGEGYFVSTASAAGLLTQVGSATYSVSKHGAVAFAEWLSVTYGSRGVRVSCLCPMGVNTAMLTEGVESADPAARAAAMAVMHSGGVLEPADVARVVLDALREEEFLILPHAEVLEFFRRKAADYDRWLHGMRRLQESVSS